MVARTAHAYIAALKTLIEGRSGFQALNGVVATFPIAGDTPFPERVIEFIRVDSRLSEFASIKGGNAQVPQDEEYVWEGRVVGLATGKGEAAGITARAAAYDLLDELDGALRDNPRINNARSNILVSADGDPAIWQDGRSGWVITFGVRVRARI